MGLGNRKRKRDNSVRDLWEIIKRINIHIIGVPKKEEREKEAESLFKEVMAENFPNLVPLDCIHLNTLKAAA